MKRYVRNVTKQSEAIETNTLFLELTKIRKAEKDDKRDKFSKNKRVRANHRKRVNKSKLKRIQQYADQLETSLPKSEVWFRNKYSNEVIDRSFKEDFFKDGYNTPFGRYIPDVSNKGYKYIIEIDGSWHDRADAKLRDSRKDYYFLKRGYIVVRIKAYDDESYKAGMERIKARVLEIDLIEKARRS